ncbi:MAG: OsmC family protein [Firmicutes bacterium]|nr:OsmC family protein [Bacillota bacterium]
MSKVSINWEGNMKFVGSDDNFEVTMDAAAVYGGQNEGIRPMELMLLSVGGCTGIEVGHILNKMRVKFDSFNIEVNGNRVDEHPKVFNNIDIIYKFTGENIPEQKVNKALQLAAEVYCSAANMVNKTAKMNYKYEINGVVYEYVPSEESTTDN